MSAVVPNQAAALPIRERDGRLELCLIRKKGSNDWGIPKGVVDPGDTLEDTALKEAWEEAGLLGTLAGPPIGTYDYSKWTVTMTVAVFVMRVTDEHPEWPEMGYRDREWLSVSDAAVRLEKHPVRTLLEGARIDEA